MKKTVSILLAFIVIFFIFRETSKLNMTKASETIQWTPINNKIYGSNICSLVISPSNPKIIYAAGIEGKIFKTIDGGNNWTQAKSIYPSCLAVDPTNSQIIYAGTGGFLYKSIDGGNTWTWHQIPPIDERAFGILTLTIDPNNSQIIYMGTIGDISFALGGVYKSINGGDGGRRKSVGINAICVDSILVDPMNSQIIYAGTDDQGIYKSINGGNNWTQINTGLTNMYISSLAMDPKNSQIIYTETSGGIYKTTNGGENWNQINPELGNEYASSLIIDPINSQIIYAGTDDSGIFKSIDGGNSWTQINAGLTNLSINFLVINPTNPTVIYAGTKNGILYATPTFTINTSSGIDGSISPSGSITIIPFTSQNYTITPNIDYRIADVKVDNISVMSELINNGNGSYSYVINNIISDHTIEAQFEHNPFIINTTAGFGGTISPVGPIAVIYGDSKTFTIHADPSFRIFRFLVDGSPVESKNPVKIVYTFNNITSNHTISAEFIRIPDNTPPKISLPTINGIDLNMPGAKIKVNSNAFTFTASGIDESGIGRMVVKINGAVKIDKTDLDPTVYLAEGLNIVEVIIYDIEGNYATKSFNIISDTYGPVIDTTLPETVSSPEIVVRGTVIDTVTGVQSLVINGNPTTITSTGTFETKFTLSKGTNIINVEATDGTGNKSTKSFTVSYLQPQERQFYSVVLKIGSPIITINDISKNIDAQNSKPIIKKGRTLLPIRILIESLGGKVEWNAKEQKIIINLNGHSMVLAINETTALVDDYKISLDVAPTIINGRTYLPLRFISEHLNGTVNWDSETQTITIYYWQ